MPHKLRLDTYAGIPLLVELLEHPDATVAGAAAGALQVCLLVGGRPCAPAGVHKVAVPMRPSPP
eukprot:364401-Chlamydomonas_euryale.AAC.3